MLLHDDPVGYNVKTQGKCMEIVFFEDGSLK